MTIKELEVIVKENKAASDKEISDLKIKMTELTAKVATAAPAKSMNSLKESKTIKLIEQLEEKIESQEDEDKTSYLESIISRLHTGELTVADIDMKNINKHY